MRDVAAEIFGYVVLLVAISLGVWETLAARKQADEDAAWLHTPNRYKRRMFMVVLLLAVSALILLETYGVLILTRVRDLVIYVTALSFAAITLLVLSIRDLSDMARSAERHAVEELNLAIQEQQNGQTKGNDTTE